MKLQINVLSNSPTIVSNPHMKVKILNILVPPLQTSSIIGFMIFHNDRNTCGGGVMLAVHILKC